MYNQHLSALNFQEILLKFKTVVDDRKLTGGFLQPPENF